jgi:hypothetical protein
MAQRFRIPDFELANPIYIGATVSAFTVDGAGAKTATLADLYADETSTTRLSNPQVLDSEGKFKQPVYADQPVILSVSGISAGDHDTGITAGAVRSRGDWATGIVYAVNDVIRVPLSNPTYGGNIYISQVRHTAGATFDADLAASRWVLLIDRQGAFPFVQLIGDTMTGPLILSGDPSAALGAATKQYVDNLVNGAKWKASARAATTGSNITLSGEQTIDTVAVVAGDRVLVKDQTAPAEDGIYVAAAGAWSRAADADTWNELVSAAIRIEEGAANAEKTFICTVNQGGTLGTTAVTFIDFGGTIAMATEAVAGLVELSSQAEAEAGASNAVVPTVLRVLQLIDALRNAYDIAFSGGYDSTFTAENLAVQTYGRVTAPRAISIIGEEADIETAPTGAALILDIEKNGVSIYSVKPQFAAASSTLTAGTLTNNPTSVAAGDVLTFKATQIGSTLPGAGLTFSVKGKMV